MLKVIQREYVQATRKKGFLIATLLGPIAMAGIMLIPVLLSDVSSERQQRIAVMDETGEIYEKLVASLRDTLSDGRPEYVFSLAQADELKSELAQKVHKDALDAYVVIGKHIFADGTSEYHAKNVSNLSGIMRIRGALNAVVVEERLTREGLDPREVHRLTRRISMKTIKVTKGGERESGFMGDYMGGFVFMMMLYMTILLYGVAVMRGILQEKSSRIVEVLLSSMSSFQLMVGKLVGLAAVGLTQIAVWIIAASFLSSHASQWLHRDIPNIVSSTSLMFFAVFFLLGYALYATLFAAVGAMCNSEQDAQQLQLLIILPLIIPILANMYIAQNPDSSISIALSLIPFFAPMVMFIRIHILTPPAWQIAASIGLLMVTIGLAVHLAARIFRVGMLMYGKRASLSEVWRWMRYR
jgi:ABC-2 type transport system permease protein